MDSTPEDVVRNIFVFLDRYSIGQVCRLNKKYQQICRNELMWKQLTLNATDSEDRVMLEKEIQMHNISWKTAYISHSLFTWDPHRISSVLQIKNKKTITRPTGEGSNPAGYGKQQLTKSRSYLEYKIDTLSSWVCLGLTNDSTVALDGGGVFSSDGKTTCSVFWQGGSSSIRATATPGQDIPMEALKSGDVIGFYLNFNENTVTVYKNHAEVGVLKMANPLANHIIYPVVGISYSTTVSFTQKRLPSIV